MTLKERIDALFLERSQLSNQLSKVNSEIGRLQRECIHEESLLEYRNEMELERFQYPLIYEYDPSGQQVAEKRSVSCTCCGHAWSELRFKGSDWQESYEWQKTQDAEKAKRRPSFF